MTRAVTLSPVAVETREAGYLAGCFRCGWRLLVPTDGEDSEYQRRQRRAQALEAVEAHRVECGS